MKYIVTGGAGFIGSECVRQLSNVDSNEVYVVDKLTYAADLNRLPRKSNVELIELDIVNFHTIQNLVNSCEAVIHFAAESHVDNSISDGSPFIYTNLEGSYSVLETCRQNNVKLVMVSTDEVYGSLSTGEADEKFNLNPSSIYSASKAGADLLTLANIRTHNQNTIITRCCNNYGPNQNSEKFIPRVLESLRLQTSIPVYGNGENIREWIHVNDHVSAILALLDNWFPGEIFNIGTRNRISNIDLVKRIIKLYGGDDSMISFVDDRKGHDSRYALDATKIHKLTNWIPSIDFEEGLQELVKESKLCIER